MKEIVIAAYARSPFTFARKGALCRVRPDELAAQVLHGLLERSGADPADLEDLLLGCAFPEGEQGLNLARLVGFLAELPLTVAGATINRFCGSSMQAIHSAAGAIALGAGRAYLCAGVESMTRVPMTGFNPLPHPGLYARYPQAYMAMGETAERVADKYAVSREAQEAFAVTSHARAAAARSAGRFVDEIVPIGAGELQVEEDGCIRPETSAAALAELAPAFRADGSVTAGTASPLTDGASATLVCSADYARERGLRPLAKIRSFAVAGCAPELMGIGPVLATRKALERAGIGVADLGAVELNEAFAAQALACIDQLELDPATVNLDGGAIALGHPLGATGARITGKAAALLGRVGCQFALATQCIGGGQGIATVLEAP